jgi:hypothetical protein
MAAILGVILRLPPVKQALASEQLRSHYLEACCAVSEPGVRAVPGGAPLHWQPVKRDCGRHLPRARLLPRQGPPEVQR